MIYFDSCRRFGVEIEINAFDGKSKPDFDGLPDGIYYVGNLVLQTVKDYVEVRRWGHTNWEKTNGYWVVKPDHSCGIEICSPVLKGWHGLKEVCKVSDALAKNNKIKADSRCSFHLHVNISDFTVEQLANILRLWIKCEPVFMDAVPDYRKNNKYCQFIGLWDWLQHDSILSSEELVELLGRIKYTTLNTYQIFRGKRSTIEFRIPENTVCLNAYDIKNWVRLLIYFTEKAKDIRSKDFSWLDPNEVFVLLGFDRSDLSEAMLQVKNWFLAKLLSNIKSGMKGAFSMKGRRYAARQILAITKENMELSDWKFWEILKPKDITNQVYSDKYKL